MALPVAFFTVDYTAFVLVVFACVAYLLARVRFKFFDPGGC